MDALRVGLTFKFTNKAEPYRKALRAAGLEPVDLTAGVREELSGLGGLVLSGGSDVDPDFYKQANHGSRNVDRARDVMEKRLVLEAIQAQLPVFAICRGLQMLNVALGGTLHQDIGESHTLTGGGLHPVTVEAGTLLHRLLGVRAEVNSRHHQAADRLGRGLRVSARAADGTVEGIEWGGAGYVLAVQWHPEDMVQRELFEDFRNAVLRVP